MGYPSVELLLLVGRPSRLQACIAQMRTEKCVSERRSCRIPGQHRFSQRLLPVRRADEDRLASDMVALARQYGRHGYRRIVALLKDVGVVNDRVNAAKQNLVKQSQSLSVAEARKLMPTATASNIQSLHCSFLIRTVI